MFASLILARAGHEVLLLERERLEACAGRGDGGRRTRFDPGRPRSSSPTSSWPSAASFLLEHLPDVYESLLAAGVAVAPLWTQMQPTLADKSPRPGDERLTLLMTRRSTIDWVLQRAVAVEPGVTVRTGARVLGLLAAQEIRLTSPACAPTRESIAADLVVDATGCRTRIDQWLAEIAARPTVHAARRMRHRLFQPQLSVPGGSDSPGARHHPHRCGVEGIQRRHLGRRQREDADGGGPSRHGSPLPDRDESVGVYGGAAHHSDLCGVARRSRADHRRVHHGRTAEHSAPPGRWKARPWRPACTRWEIRCAPPIRPSGEG